jgi:chemotaxis protein histidine kinase CheA
LADPLADALAGDGGAAAASEPASTDAGDGMRLVGSLAVPAPLFDIYVAEATALAQALKQAFTTWRGRGGLDPEALHLAHTLAGTSGTVGFMPLRELAFALETTLQAAPATLHDPAHHDLFDLVMGRVTGMLASFAAGDMAAAAPELIAALARLQDELAHAHAGGPDLAAAPDAMPAAPQPAPAAAQEAPPAHSAYHRKRPPRRWMNWRRASMRCSVTPITHCLRRRRCRKRHLRQHEGRLRQHRRHPRQHKRHPRQRDPHLRPRTMHLPRHWMRWRSASTRCSATPIVPCSPSRHRCGKMARRRHHGHRW